jgi:hypothetical protein
MPTCLKFSIPLSCAMHKIEAFFLLSIGFISMKNEKNNSTVCIPGAHRRIPGRYARRVSRFSHSMSSWSPSTRNHSESLVWSGVSITSTDRPHISMRIQLRAADQFAEEYFDPAYAKTFTVILTGGQSAIQYT